jgi:hypothetical protein
MSDRIPPDEFDDVNEAVGEEWEAETTPYERIRRVIAHTYAPVSADTVASDSRTSPKTARKHPDDTSESHVRERRAFDRERRAIRRRWPLPGRWRRSRVTDEQAIANGRGPLATGSD